jgi:hypothetical protein
VTADRPYSLHLFVLLQTRNSNGLGLDRASKGRSVVGYTNGKNGYTKWFLLVGLLLLDGFSAQFVLVPSNSVFGRFDLAAGCHTQLFVCINVIMMIRSCLRI